MNEFKLNNNAKKTPRIFDTTIRLTTRAADAAEFNTPNINTLKQKYGYGSNTLYDDYLKFSEEFINYAK